jgi:hypothetical protein
MHLQLFGLLWSGPSAHYWQELLQRLFAGKTGPTVILQKVGQAPGGWGPAAGCPGLDSSCGASRSRGLGGPHHSRRPVAGASSATPRRTAPHSNASHSTTTHRNLWCLQVLLDQLTYGPLCNILFMSYTSTVVGGESGAAKRSPVAAGVTLACAPPAAPTGAPLSETAHRCSCPHGSTWEQGPPSPSSRRPRRRCCPLAGMSAEQLAARLRRDYPSVQQQGWRLWPLASLVNYRFVPIQYRVLFVNLVALCW